MKATKKQQSGRGKSLQEILSTVSEHTDATSVENGISPCEAKRRTILAARILAQVQIMDVSEKLRILAQKMGGENPIKTMAENLDYACKILEKIEP